VLLITYVSSATGELKIPSMKIGTDVHGKGVFMPMGGIGTWLYNNSQAESEVLSALKLGARLIDTAYNYENEKGVAAGVKKSKVPRSEIFLTTKIPGGLSTADTISAHESNLEQLETDYVDLLLTHFPCGFPTSPTSPPVNCSKAARQDTWRGLEAMYKAGKARAIGVSHYCQQHILDVLEIATVPIAVDQEEWHVGMGTDPQGLVSFGKKHGISYQSFSPLCGPCSKKDHEDLISGPLVTSIGKAHNVSGVQVALKWLVQNGSPVIPKSSDPAHIQEDLDLFSFTLTDAEMAKLNAATTPPSAEPVSADCKLPEETFLI
jgi:diketogulonate reductase-like aldo/keto reductase